jgi:microcystin-dependent protein
LTTAELAAHSHTIPSNDTDAAQNKADIASNTGDAGSLTSNATGGSTAHNNMQPFITVYMWQRTA